MTREEFIEEVLRLGVRLTEQQLNQLERYYELLIEWNEKINLTRIVEKNEVYLKHFYDSITLCKVTDLNKSLSLCDIGTGAGFPGIVLKIVFPELSITLLDAREKRVNFLNMVIKDLALNNIEAIHIRAEDFAKIHKKGYDIVTCRAVASLSMLIPYCVPLIKDDGFFLPLKANCEEEIKEAEKILKRNKCIISQIEEFELPIENSRRTIIKIIKDKK